MANAGSLVFSLLLLSASFTGSWGQDESGGDYWRNLENEAVALRQQVQLNTDAAASSAHQIADLEFQLTSAKQNAQSAQAQLQGAQGESQAAQQKLQASQAELQAAQAVLKSVPEVAACVQRPCVQNPCVQHPCPTLSAATGECPVLSAPVCPTLAAAPLVDEDAWLPIWLQRRINTAVLDGKVLLEELKVGNTSRYGKIAWQTYSCIEHSAQVAWARILLELDTRAPGTKEKIGEYVDVVRPYATKAWLVLDEYVISAKWPRQIMDALIYSEGELRTFLTQQLKSRPALAPYADPVLIQVVVYAFFVLPLFLVVVPILSAIFAPRRVSVVVPAAGKKKKAGGKAAAKPAK